MAACAKPALPASVENSAAGFGASGIGTTGSGVTGIGWRHPHYAAVLETLPQLGFLEVHSENFFALGGAALATLMQARQHYPISLHGVGLGLGSACGVDPWHLARLRNLVERIDPVRVSDHACFARGLVNGVTAHAADLLPIPFNNTALDVLCANVQQVQEGLSRTLLVENLSAYMPMPGADRSETEFLRALVQRTGCQLLVDVNNIYVNALNAQTRSGADHNAAQAVRDCCNWLDEIAPGSVGEIHLAGHCHTGQTVQMGQTGQKDQTSDTSNIVIDDHGSPVCEGVWQVYTHAVRRFGAVPALVEWDTAIPPLHILLDEAARADAIQHRVCPAPADVPGAS